MLFSCGRVERLRRPTLCICLISQWFIGRPQSHGFTLKERGCIWRAVIWETCRNVNHKICWRGSIRAESWGCICQCAEARWAFMEMTHVHYLVESMCAFSFLMPLHTSTLQHLYYNQRNLCVFPPTSDNAVLIPLSYFFIKVQQTHPVLQAGSR